MVSSCGQKTVINLKGRWVGWGGVSLEGAVEPLGLILFIGPCEIFFCFSSFPKSLSSVSICWNSAYLPFPLILLLESVKHRPQMVFACIYTFPANIILIQFATQRITWRIKVVNWLNCSALYFGVIKGFRSFLANFTGFLGGHFHMFALGRGRSVAQWQGVSCTGDTPGTFFFFFSQKAEFQ